jgi:hypothetical protein
VYEYVTIYIQVLSITGFVHRSICYSSCSCGFAKSEIGVSVNPETRSSSDLCSLRHEKLVEVCRSQYVISESNGFQKETLGCEMRHRRGHVAKKFHRRETLIGILILKIANNTAKRAEGIKIESNPIRDPGLQ